MLNEFTKAECVVITSDLRTALAVKEEKEKTTAGAVPLSVRCETG